ncbi:MAG: hypothetical protein ACYDBB_19275 [Armatimonadota bacterium]
MATVIGMPSTTAARMPALPTMPPAADARIAYYAFGGGLGHVTRAAAILRHLTRRGYRRLQVFTNAPTVLPLTHEQLSYRHFAVNTPAVLQVQVPIALQEYAPDVLIVDVFPLGIIGELTNLLPALPGKKVLVYRRLQETFYTQLLDALPLFDQVLCAERPPASFPAPYVDCQPILIRDAEELLPREEARRRLGIHDDRMVVVGVSTGDAEWETDFCNLLQKVWRRVQPDAHLRFASVRKTAAHYPLFELCNGIDLVIGAAGYNLFHETQAAGVPAIFLPQPRQYDDQFRRVRQAQVATSPEELEEALRQAAAEFRPEEKKPAAFENGAIKAAESINMLAR